MDNGTQLYSSNALLKQTFAKFNHDKFYNYAIAFVNASVVKNNCNVLNMCNVINMFIDFERNMFGKSLLLNGLVNFCISHSDGDAIQHKLLTNVLGFLLTKYY
ncbi:hypothetical protein [Palpita vitrealis nucleopolyhedrovirus]|uniref:Ac19 n=1 Tax=Palpita vitrealis nucleopolyhedrovirus TaxID=2951960 RepID=A0AAE9LNC8_9ABAC|nr:hypothetical protein [Palpita vitrealis nucleopolyhedrovirus]